MTPATPRSSPKPAPMALRVFRPVGCTPDSCTSKPGNSFPITQPTRRVPKNPPIISASTDPQHEVLSTRVSGHSNNKPGDPQTEHDRKDERGPPPSEEAPPRRPLAEFSSEHLYRPTRPSPPPWSTTTQTAPTPTTRRRPPEEGLCQPFTSTARPYAI